MAFISWKHKLHCVHWARGKFAFLPIFPVRKLVPNVYGKFLLALFVQLLAKDFSLIRCCNLYVTSQCAWVWLVLFFPANNLLCENLLFGYNLGNGLISLAVVSQKYLIFMFFIEGATKTLNACFRTSFVGHNSCSGCLLRKVDHDLFFIAIASWLSSLPSRWDQKSS